VQMGGTEVPTTGHTVPRWFASRRTVTTSQSYRGTSTSRA